MSRIFLGRWQHWLVIVVLCALAWLAGRERLHVTDFNLFVWLTIASTIVVLLLIFATSRPHEQVTRDPIEDDDPPAEPAATRPADHERA